MLDCVARLTAETGEVLEIMEEGIRSVAADNTRSALPSSTVRDLNIVLEMYGDVIREMRCRDEM